MFAMQRHHNGQTDDGLDGERTQGKWNGEAPPPRLPSSVVQATSTRYLDAFRRITGTEGRVFMRGTLSAR